MPFSTNLFIAIVVNLEFIREIIVQFLFFALKCPISSLVTLQGTKVVGVGLHVKWRSWTGPFTLRSFPTPRAVVRSLVISRLQIYCWIWRWKNFENRSTVGEVIGKSRVSCFFDSRTCPSLYCATKLIEVRRLSCTRRVSLNSREWRGKRK